MSHATAASPAKPPVAGDPSLIRLIGEYCAMGVLLGAVLRFVSGRPDWFRAWLYIGCTLTFQVMAGVVLERVNPGLLAERSRMRKGTKGWDRILAPIVALFGPLAIWLVAAMDVRHHWPPAVPVWSSAVAFGACISGFILTFWAMLVNRFFSATVRIQSDRGHVVVDCGPYRYLRHPGYLGAFAFSIASPVALGSWMALIPGALVAAVLVLRTALEDRTLSMELQGYRDYGNRVRYRLLPGIW